MADKKKFEDTKVGKFLKSKGLDTALEMASNSGIPGVSTGASILNSIKDMVLGDTGGVILSEADKMQFLELYKLELEEYDKMLADTASARDMQKAALAQDDVFSKRFVYYLTIFWSVFAATYIMCITFAKIPEQNIRFADTMNGFVMGTIVAAIMAFYYGSTAKSQSKDATIQKLAGK